jgi:hypothetical protein
MPEYENSNEYKWPEPKAINFADSIFFLNISQGMIASNPIPEKANSNEN